MREETDVWRENPCGCRLQKTIDRNDTNDRATAMWVIREECPSHIQEYADVRQAIRQWQDEKGKGWTYEK